MLVGFLFSTHRESITVKVLPSDQTPKILYWNECVWGKNVLFIYFYLGETILCSTGKTFTFQCTLLSWKFLNVQAKKKTLYDGKLKHQWFGRLFRLYLDTLTPSLSFHHSHSHALFSIRINYLCTHFPQSNSKPWLYLSLTLFSE